MVEAGAYPSPLNYYNFPKSVCTSVNEVGLLGTPLILLQYKHSMAHSSTWDCPDAPPVMHSWCFWHVHPCLCHPAAVLPCMPRLTAILEDI
jgi:methionine aminopeptidase